jgi:hypothetical protein
VFQQHLLTLSRGNWISYMLKEEGEVIAVLNEKGLGPQGMPVLGVVKDLDKEILDFLVSAWCVKTWGHLRDTLVILAFSLVCDEDVGRGFQ